MLCYVAPGRQAGERPIERSLGSLFAGAWCSMKCSPARSRRAGKSPFRLAAEKAREAHKAGSRHPRPAQELAGSPRALSQGPSPATVSTRPPRSRHCSNVARRQNHSSPPAGWRPSVAPVIISSAIKHAPPLDRNWRTDDYRPNAAGRRALRTSRIRSSPPALPCAVRSCSRRRQRSIPNSSARPARCRPSRCRKSISRIAPATSYARCNDGCRQPLVPRTRRRSLHLDAARACAVTRDLQVEPPPRYAQLAGLKQGRQRQYARILQARMLEQVGRE